MRLACIITLALLTGCAARPMTANEIRAADLETLRAHHADPWQFSHKTELTFWHGAVVKKATIHEYATMVRAEAVSRMDWPDEEKERVLDGWVWNGMTHDQLFWSIGHRMEFESQTLSPFGLVQRYEIPGGLPYRPAFEVTLYNGRVAWWRDNGDPDMPRSMPEGE
jgi:hypothetical protein